MRVLLTLDGVGGVLTYAAELIAGLSGAGVEVAAVSFGRPLSGEQVGRLRGAGAFAVHDSGLALEWEPDPWDDLARAGDLLAELVERHEVDVVHAGAYFPGALELGVPVIVVAHSCVLSWWRAVHGEAAPPDWARYRAVVGAGLAGAEAVIAPTQAMAAALRAEYGAPAHRSVEVIANASSAPLHDPAAPREAVALAAGRMWDAAKNLGVLEAVAARVIFPLLVAGEPARPGPSQEPAGSGPVRLGLLDPETLRRRRESAAVFVAPARYEPFGLAILEAARSGDALVLGDIASLRELWDGAARFVAPDDAEAIAWQITDLLEHPGRRLNLARAAQTRALGYGRERMVGAHLALLHRLVSPRERTLT